MRDRAEEFSWNLTPLVESVECQTLTDWFWFMAMAHIYTGCKYR